ncbi:MAG: isopenicillin N synthase family oxygenase [Rhodospirillaceae bacterium]|nr:isopenicillin N synthase family oxygenase [Rhodospirillaceae bacterium]
MTIAAKTETLPILDFREIDGDPAQRQAFLARLRGAARDTGFFYLTGHGIDPDFLDQLFALWRRFFELPEAEKTAIEMVHSPHFRGYTRIGWEQTRGQRDWREQLDVGAEREKVTPKPGDPAWVRLQGPNQWPQALPELRPAILRWQQEATALAIRLVRAFAASLGQAEDVFEPIYAEKPNQLVKIIRYPGRDATQSEQGVGAHKDSSFVTILLQHAQSGLQVEGPHGWIDAPPLRGSFIINVGELLEMASSGYLRATVHRVTTPPAGTDRLSIAFFLGARLDSVVPVLTLSPELAAEATGVAQDPHNPLFREVGKNYLKGRLRSHPDVARRHYADQLTPDELAKAAGPGSAY